MKTFLKKKRFALITALLLTGFTAYALLDTFVIPRGYTVVSSAVSSSSGTDAAQEEAASAGSSLFGAASADTEADAETAGVGTGGGAGGVHGGETGRAGPSRMVAGSPPPRNRARPQAAILILAWASAPLAFAALSWARNSAGAGTRARRAHGSPPGPRADTSLARARRRRRPASRLDGLVPTSPWRTALRKGEEARKWPARQPSGATRFPRAASGDREPRRGDGNRRTKMRIAGLTPRLRMINIPDDSQAE